jgi:hypothetical protein
MLTFRWLFPRPGLSTYLPNRYIKKAKVLDGVSNLDSSL